MINAFIILAAPGQRFNTTQEKNIDSFQEKLIVKNERKNKEPQRLPCGLNGWDGADMAGRRGKGEKNLVDVHTVCLYVEYQVSLSTQPLHVC